MEIVKLSVRKPTIDAIRRGEVREYAREIRPNTQDKYCDIDEEGYVRDIDGILQPRKYDAVQFSCGHETFKCKVESARIELFEDENHNLVTYNEDGEDYYAAQVVYTLGKEVL